MSTLNSGTVYKEKALPNLKTIGHNFEALIDGYQYHT